MKSMKIKELAAGQGGYADPWCLAELRNPVEASPPNLERDAPRPPEPLPERSGLMFLWGEGTLYSEAVRNNDGHYTMPVERTSSGALEVDLTGLKLAHAPRLEFVGALTSGGYLACQVTGLKEALETGPPVTAENQKAAAAQEEPAGTQNGAETGKQAAAGAATA